MQRGWWRVDFAGYQLQRRPAVARASCAHARIGAHERLDGSVVIAYRGSPVGTAPSHAPTPGRDSAHLKPTPAAAADHPPRGPPWLKGGERRGPAGLM